MPAVPKRRGFLLLAVVSCVGQACLSGEEFTTETPIVADLGALCSFHSDCQVACLMGHQHQAKYCTSNCSSETLCPAGYHCASRQEVGPVCVMVRCDDGDACPDGFTCDDEEGVCVPPAVACSSDDDCPGAIACVQGSCAATCDATSACKANYRCSGHVCVECVGAIDCRDNFACMSGQCSLGCVVEADCRTGYDCVAHVCEPIVGGGAGTVGTSCQEDSECEGFCGPNHLCSKTCAGEDDESCGEGYMCEPNHAYCVQQY